MSKTMGEVISTRRKALEMTQSELAEKMGITDKAVSKWERDLSCPDISSIPKLAEILGVSLEELLSVEHSASEDGPEEKQEGETEQDGLSGSDQILLWLGSVLGGSAVLASAIHRMNGCYAYFFLIGAGMFCLGVYLMRQRYWKKETPGTSRAEEGIASSVLKSQPESAGGTSPSPIDTPQE